MKKSEKYLEEEIDKLHDNDQPWYDAGIYDGTALPILNAIKRAQIDAIEATCKRCAEEAETDFEPLGWLAEQHMNTPFIEGEDYEVPIIRTSILKVADKMKEELE